MNKITANRKWCHIDQLDGKDLVDGERLRVKFPNNEVIEITISVHSSIETVGEMGRSYEMPIKRAYLATKWKGQQCMVELVGLYAERVKAK